MGVCIDRHGEVYGDSIHTHPPGFHMTHFLKLSLSSAASAVSYSVFVYLLRSEECACADMRFTLVVLLCANVFVCELITVCCAVRMLACVNDVCTEEDAHQCGDEEGDYL